jgi:perosamine synthetase
VRGFVAWFEGIGIEPVREPEGACSNYWFNAFLIDDLSACDTILKQTKHRARRSDYWNMLHILPAFRNQYTADLSISHWLYERLVNVPSSLVM